MDESGRVKLFNLGRYSTTQIDHAIALNALKVMKPEGRAVLILGGKLGGDAERSSRYNSRSSRAFYFTLYQEYNVIHHFSIWGDLYRRQGAGFMGSIDGFKKGSFYCRKIRRNSKGLNFNHV
uniref:Uncharacterized protein n=1 Tax=Tolypothrix bouteillei VB521301 TaxID=1479485 RepID=A0A0C1N4W2_9CYAN